ncbi:uncharacterized protein VTP21DRAFT_3443 [Calcarisporiella thermophila]|uniref:uncharacterized protein n=1 Tax=Calcarisporiella thermophila TaxID=911321 RepID=UPI003743BEEA
MWLKREIELWNLAVNHFDKKQYEQAINTFKTMADWARVRFNIGMVYANMGLQQTAIRWFDSAVKLDKYLAIAYFQRGVSNFLLGNMAAAQGDFSRALICFRGNNTIDYSQLGLDFKLYSCEVLFNRGLSLIYQGKMEEGLKLLERARAEKLTPDHNAIDEAIAARGESFTVFSLSAGMLFRPCKDKVKHTARRQYLEEARVIASTEGDFSTGFKGNDQSNMVVEACSEELLSFLDSHSDSTPISPGVFPPAAPLHANAMPGPVTPVDGMYPLKLTVDTPTTCSLLDEDISVSTADRAARSIPTPPEEKSYPRSSTRRHSRYRPRGMETEGVMYDELQIAEEYMTTMPSPSDMSSSWDQDYSVADLSRDYPTHLPSPHHSPLATGAGMYPHSPSPRGGYLSVRKDSLFSSSGVSAASSSATDSQLATKIKIKCIPTSQPDQMRVLLLDKEGLTFRELMRRVQEKFRIDDRVVLRYRDEDGMMVIMADDEDLDCARTLSCNSKPGRMERLEIWVS